MSYTPYTPPATSGAPPTSTTYPYGAYQGAYAGAYSYQTNPYHTGVTSYGWPYFASFVQHPQTPQVQRAPTQQAPTPAAPSTTTAQAASSTTTTAATTTPAVATTSTPVPPQRSTTFTAYTPAYLRDNAATTTSSGPVSRGKRQSNLKGLFTKECQGFLRCSTNGLHRAKCVFRLASEKLDVWLWRRQKPVK